MEKKDKKKKEVLICIDCDEKTTDYYKISTNKGHIVKCAKCYELWMTRLVRSNSMLPNPHSRNTNLNYYDE
mgnify:CR=1 FL=1